MPVEEKAENVNDKEGGDVLVYKPKNRQENALELYLEDTDSDFQEYGYDDPEQKELIQAMCQKLQAKAQELKVSFGLKDPSLKSKAKATPTEAQNAASSSGNTDNNSPFLSEEERLMRQRKIKAMKKAKREAQAETLQRWKENKQERKDAADRREATLQSNIKTTSVSWWVTRRDLPALSSCETCSLAIANRRRAN